MNPEAKHIIELLVEAVEKQQDKPSYEDYQNGKLTRDEYYEAYYEWDLINRIKGI